jgi:hypothetical protein
MFKLSSTRVLLFLILVFSFAYRLLLMHWATYPPGADIGLHNSVIHSIIGSGSVDFLWNNYQMGGGLSLTFPGYHIFASYIILLTGIPDFVAHSLVVSLFSTLIVAIAFLVTRKLWGESTAFIVAFLVAVSRFDVEMLMWGGYPNVITLALIPLVFYLYMQRERFSLFPFLATSTLLIGAIYLTHSLSAVMFVSLTFAFVVFGLVLSRKIGVALKQLAVWVLPLFLGAVIVSPFLVHAVPAYLGANSETFTGGVSDIRLALLSTRVLPAEIVVPLFACVIFFFLFSKEYKGKFLTVSSLLLALWIMVPMVFTQGYLVGLYTDYNRFLYFVLFPLIILIGMVIDHSARLLSQIAHAYLSAPREKLQHWKGVNDLEARLNPHLTRKNIYSFFLLALLLFLFFWVTLFLTPWEGTRVQGFYQVMDNPGYEAIQWARENTPPGSVFVSDALYGWWFGGFAQRPTISAVDPQYLTVSREFEPAKAAKNLLDTDYVIDNGLIQVREDGGYIGRHNPMFLAKLNWTYFPYDFFNFINSNTIIGLRNGSKTESFDLTQLPVIEMHMETNSDEASIFVSKGNGSLNYTQIVTVYKGVSFVDMSIKIESAEDVSVYQIQFLLQTKGTLVDRGKTIGFLDEGAKVLGQLIFVDEQPQIHRGPELLYTLDGSPEATIQISAGVFSISNDPTIYQDPDKKANFINGLLDENLNSYKNKIADFPLDVFDYRTALREWNISYIACRESDVLPKFIGDPAFSTVFINDEVAVFKVKSSFR